MDTCWWIDGEKNGNSDRLFSWAPKSLWMVTAAMKLRLFLLGRKAMTNLDSILKNRDIPWLTKVCIVKAMVFPVVMYGCESWTIKKAEHWWINVFELWCWWRLLRVPWTARWSYQSILKEIRTEYTLKDRYWTWNSNTLTTWCEELAHWKRPDAGKNWGQEEKGVRDEMVRWHHQLNGHGSEQILGDGERQGSLVCCNPWDSRVGYDWGHEQPPVCQQTSFVIFIKHSVLFLLNSIVEIFKTYPNSMRGLQTSPLNGRSVKQCEARL